jgi:acylphosphatase
VQGVWYRASAQRKAQELRLSGWVRNEADGSVSVEVQGAEPELTAFRAWCRRGPQHAQVERVKTEPCPPLADSQEFIVQR